MKPHTQNPSIHKPFRAAALTPSAWGALLLIASVAPSPRAHAQSATEPTLAPVVVSAPPAQQQLSVGGFGDVPLRETPISATVITAQDIQASGAQRLADLYKLDSSVSDAYNAVGYIDYATVRGFVIDNRFNYRRDGLPISGDTPIGLANKERIEILKGTSGIQAGTSAPGGLVNYIVKRPTLKPVRSVDVSVDSNGQIGAALDLGGRFGEGSAQGYRLNVTTSRLNSAAPGTRGSQQLLALALDSRVGRDGLLEGEFEWSRQSQPNVPGLSLLGNAGTLPPANPKINLNRQAWSQPTVFEGLTGSIRYTQYINDRWQWGAHLASQRLKADDRLAYPFGCTDSNGIDYYADRYCPNGDFDLYDYRSENERRQSNSAQLSAKGQFFTGAIKHDLTIGFQTSRYTERGQPQADNNNPVGTGNIYTLPLFQPDPSFFDPYTNRTEKSTELFAFDTIQWTEKFRTWFALRHTRIQRESIRTDGSRATDYGAQFSAPFLAASYLIAPQVTAYASYGQGIESEVAPGRNRYTNANQALPALKSTQKEIGVKSSSQTTRWNVTVFEIDRPISGDRLNGGATQCGAAGSCTRVMDGDVRHRGLELGWGTSMGAWAWDASGTWLNATRRNSAIDPALNGLKPTNVPSHILRLNATYRVAPNWLLGAHISHEGRRAILPDNSLFLPAWTRLDASVKWDTRLSGRKSTLQLGVNNLLDKRFFQESPFQFGHAYLFPAQPRTLRMSLNISLQ
jgi:iron complex outermembrane recepter protein